MTATPTLLASRYRLGTSLGVGGMGRVWLAADEVLDRQVAIKEIVLPDEFDDADRTEAQQRTLQEARAAARLSHPGVVQIYDVLEADGRTWIVMEYVPSRSLQQVLKSDGPLAPGRAARIGLEVLAALAAAHAAGVWHRDVKPANVLLAEDGHVVLTDFGIATIEGDSLVTSSGLVLGSPAYMSPERARYGTAGAASDLWSLGATLYAAVEGRSPFQRPSSVETLTALVSAEPDPAVRAGALRPVLDGLLRKDPADRIDLAEARRRLEDAAADDAVPDEPTVANPTAASVAVPPRTSPPGAEDDHPAPAEVPPDPVPAAPRARRSVLATVAAALALAVGTTVWFTAREDAAGPAAAPTAAPDAGVDADPARPEAPASDGPGTGSPAPAATRGSEPALNTGTDGEASNRRPELPAGWRDHRDPTGFSVYVPAGWNRSREGTIVYFRDPDTGRVLGIDQTDDPKPDPVADWRAQSAYRVDRGDFPGYRQVRIAAVDYGREAADWEFTFDGRSRQHVNNRGVVFSASKAYGIYWQTRDADWADARPDLQLVFDSFRPATD